MSPYAEYPKNPRSQEWGREAIEMHENGSTKNLLQMTDVYYSVCIHMSRVISGSSFLWGLQGLCFVVVITLQLELKTMKAPNLLFI